MNTVLVVEYIVVSFKKAIFNIGVHWIVATRKIKELIRMICLYSLFKYFIPNPQKVGGHG